MPEHDVSRRLFMILSPRSLPYSRFAFESLYQNCADRFHLTLITDTQEDVLKIGEVIAEQGRVSGAGEAPLILGEDQLNELEASKFGKYEHICNFRRGHPCWRKITDPILLSEPGEEVVVLDPDLYFPNRFRFEQTPEAGVLLMWQRPSCLLPPEVVEAAISAKIPLAHHTDIGVSQWRMPIDLEWLDWLLCKIGSPQLPRNMHVESIVWAALAMHMGGGYLDPRRWSCWHRTQLNRLMIRSGVSGVTILKREPFEGMKCFHAGGVAKWWLADAKKAEFLDVGGDLLTPSPVMPYVELTPALYHTFQRNRRWLRKAGYYSLFGES